MSRLIYDRLMNTGLYFLKVRRYVMCVREILSWCWIPCHSLNLVPLIFFRFETIILKLLLPQSHSIFCAGFSIKFN